MASKLPEKRNNKLLDRWSVVHLAFGILAVWLFPPFIAFLILAIWEPIEIFVLSPLLRHFGIIFGYESARNSLSDIVVNSIGIVFGLLIKRLI